MNYKLNSLKPLYAKVAFIWGMVFLIAGMLFLIIPNVLTEHLNDLAQVLMLNGEIHAPSGTLWHVLTISLMGLLVYLAFQSAQNPQQKNLFVALLLAKSISVFGFIWLTYNLGTAWLVCAMADASVAFTLLATYPKNK